MRRPEATAARFREIFGPAPVTTRQAEGAGFTRHQLRAALARGLLASPRHGVVTIARSAPDVDVEEASPAPHDPTPNRIAESVGNASTSHREHLDAIRAALQVVGGDAFATGPSAAAVWGLPTPTRPDDVVHLCRPGASDFAGPGLVVRGSPIPAHQVEIVEGIPTTDIRRTAIDLARGGHLPHAVIPLDAAARALIASASGARDVHELRRAVHDRELRRQAERELRYVMESCRGWRGVRSVRHGLDHVEPASESPLESRSRGWFIEEGVLGLDVGVEVEVAGRRFWADFARRERRVIGEADGWMKYDVDPRAAIAAERERQRLLEADGWRVVRWTSDERRATVVARMRDALADSEARRRSRSNGGFPGRETAV